MRVDLAPVLALPAAVVDRWEALAERAATPNPFAEAAVLRSAARHLAGGSRVQLLTVHEPSSAGGALLLALPVVHGRPSRWSAVPVLSGWAHAYSYLGEPLVVEHRAQQAWAAVLDALARRRVAPVLLLPRLRARSASTAALRRAAAATGTPCAELAHHQRAVVHRRPEPDYLDGRLSGPHRKGLRRQGRVLSRALGGPVEVVDATGRPDAVEQFLHLEAAGWKGRAGTAMASRPGDADFLREVQQAWSARVQVLLLEGGGRAAAVQVGLRAGRDLFCFKTAYDESLAACSPGLQLMVASIERFHDDPSLVLLDSCADPDHPMADRLMPDRSELCTVSLALSRPGALAHQALTTLRDAARNRLTRAGA